MYNKMLAVFFRRKVTRAIRAFKENRFCVIVALLKLKITDLAKKLSFSAVIAIYVIMRCTAARAYSFIRNRAENCSAFYWFYRLFVLPKIIFKQKFVIVFLKFYYKRQFISLKFLIFRAVEFIVSPLP
jgi:hypothetical protein